MGWPYRFVDLDEVGKAARRDKLDEYATYATLSVLLPVLLALGYRAARWGLKATKAAGGGSYDVIPDSPLLKVQRQSSAGSLSATLRRLRWWLGEEVYLLGEYRGKRDMWVLGTLWGVWLMLLCFLGTGDDYLHLTKRFGMIAASQFPIHYMLSLKFLNPFAYVFRTSHEQVNRWHRLQGRIIYFLLFLHAAFYLNYFVQVGILQRRLFAPVVFAGFLSWVGINLIMATALPAVRRFSYRLFFITHLAVSFSIPPMLFYHAPPARISMGAALVFLLLDITVRRLLTVTGKASLSHIPGTTLVRVSLALPHNRVNAFREHPGSHVYLSIPAAGRPSQTQASIASLLFEFLFNPFTVADVDDQTGELVIVARHRGGPMTTALARFARATQHRHNNTNNTGSSAINPIGWPAATTTTPAAAPNYDESRIPLSIEGPYGAAAHFPHLAGSEFDRVLLVAGGVGATFAVPLYRALLHDNPSARVELVWALRGAGDATWAVQEGGGSRSILTDDAVSLYLTGDMYGNPSSSSSSASSSSSPARPRGGSTLRASSPIASTGGAEGSGGSGGAGVEMNALYRDRRRGGKYTAMHNRRRPDLRKIVDDTFKHGLEERVAILVCGPPEMARELRTYVGAWVSKGRSVWFHDESFGW